MKIYLFLFYSCCSFFLAARGQLSTIPTILLPNDSVNISFRLNMCNEVNRVMDGSVSLSNVLKGKNVSFGIRQSTWPSNVQAWLQYDSQKVPAPYDGFMYQLIQKLASKMQFNPQFVIIPAKEFEVATTYLARANRKVDFIAATWFTNTLERHLQGVGFTQSLDPLDSSYYLVVEQEVVQAPINWFAFASPFADSVWGLIALMLLVNGIVMFIFRKPSEEDKEESGWRGFFHYIYLSFGQYVAVGELPANTIDLKLVHLGCGFAVLILTATYTSVLTSSLVVAKKIVAPLKSIDEANTKRASICIQAKTSQFEYISRIYPNVKIVSTPKAGMLYLSNTPSICDGAVVIPTEFDLYSSDAQYNPSCDIVKVGDPIYGAQFGFPYKEDLNDRCTSLAALSMNIGILQLINDGVIQNLWRNKLRELQTVSCDVEKISVSAESMTQFGIQDLAGVFFVYMIFLVVFLIFRVIRVFIAPPIIEKLSPTRRQEISSKESEEQAHRDNGGVSKSHSQKLNDGKTLEEGVDSST